MNENTLKRLQSNPHYKLSPKQKSEAKEIARKPMRTFGDVETHNDTPEIHKPKVIRKGRNVKR